MNTNNNVIIDSTFFNYALISKHTLAFQTAGGPVTGGYGNQASLTVQGDAPVVAARSAHPFTVCRARPVAGGFEFGFISRHGGGGSPWRHNRGLRFRSTTCDRSLWHADLRWPGPHRVRLNEEVPAGGRLPHDVRLIANRTGSDRRQRAVCLGCHASGLPVERGAGDSVVQLAMGVRGWLCLLAGGMGTTCRLGTAERGPTHLGGIRPRWHQAAGWM